MNIETDTKSLILCLVDLALKKGVRICIDEQMGSIRISTWSKSGTMRSKIKNQAELRLCLIDPDMKLEKALDLI